jgi:hypothetical protein
MKTYGRSECIAQSIFTSSLNGGERLALRTGRFTTTETAACTNWIGGWAPEPFWTLWREKSLVLAANRTLASQPVALPRQISASVYCLPIRAACPALHILPGFIDLGRLGDLWKQKEEPRCVYLLYSPLAQICSSAHLCKIFVIFFCPWSQRSH